MGTGTGVTYDDVDARLKELKELMSRRIEDIKPAKPATDYLPSEGKLRIEIASGVVDPQALIRQQLVAVKERWDRLQAEGLGSLANMGPHAAATAASLARVRGLPKKFGNLRFKLRIGQTTPARGGAVAVRRLVEEEGATFDGVLGRVTRSAEHAAKAVMAIRRLDDVAVRVLAARAAAGVSGLPLPEVLALYREEGNMGVYPSDESLQSGIPSGVSKEGVLISIGHRPDISNLVWLADRAKAEHQALDASLETYSLVTAFMVQVVGLDVVASRFAGADTVTEFAKWSARNWIAAGLADPGDVPGARVEAADRWIALEDDLVATTTRGFSGSEDEAVWIAPAHPETFLAGVLTEAAVFQRTLHDPETLIGEFTTVSLGESLPAIRYNFQVTPSHVAGMFLSALQAAVDGRARTALRASVRADPDLLALLKRARQAMDEAAAPEITKKKKSEAMEIAQAGAAVREDKLVPELRSWILDGNNFQLLKDFVEQATTTQWGGYQGLRSYAWHSRWLREFYARVLPQ